MANYNFTQGNGLANYNGWTTNYNGSPFALDGSSGMMVQQLPNNFVGPPQSVGLDQFVGQTGTLNGQDLTLGTGNSGSGLSNVMGYVGAGAGVLQGLSGLANAYMGYKNYKLAKEQFGFQKGLANRNLANQSKIINNSYDNAAQVAAGMIGGGSYNPTTDSQGNYGMTDQAVVDKYAQKAKEKHVDGSPV